MRAPLSSVSVAYLTRVVAPSQAGRLPEFDTLASQFYAATGAARDAIYRDASALAAAAGPAAHHYVRVMEKVVNGSEEYVEREAKRCVTGRVAVRLR